MPLKITLEEVDGNGILVVSGGLFASHLDCGEALAVVASLLFGGRGCVPYMNTYENTRIWDRKPVAGLLPDHVEPMPLSDFVIYRRELIADAKGV